MRRSADDGSVLLNGVSLSVPAGSTTAVVGAPGSGKTLLLRAMSLLDPVESGEIRFRGRPVEDHEVPRFRRRVILLPQRSVLIEGSVRSNLQLPYAFAPTSEADYDEPRINSWLTSLDRDAALLDRDVRDLSGGESQVVALIRAVQLDPDVLLLDEPTSSLDAETTGAVERLVDEWYEADSQRALVVVTHLRAQAERIAETSMRMESGSITSEENHVGRSA